MSCCPSVCAPSCATPSCAAAPSVGFGPCGISGFGGGFGGCFGGYGGVPASSLGIVPGAAIGCLNQIPSSEVTVQPPSVTLVLPGPIMAASCEPLAVGGYNPCASGSSGYGLGGYGRLGSICRSSRKCRPCIPC